MRRDGKTLYVNYCTDKDIEILNRFTKASTRKNFKELHKKLGILIEKKDKEDFSNYAKVREIVTAINLIYTEAINAVEREYNSKINYHNDLPEFVQFGKCRCVAFNKDYFLRDSI